MDLRNLLLYILMLASPKQRPIISYLESYLESQTRSHLSYHHEDVCQTDKCYKLRDELLYKSMNLSVDPCADFYAYACGNWAEHHPLVPNKNETNSLFLRTERVQQEIIDVLVNAITFGSKSPDVKHMAQLYMKCLNRNHGFFEAEERSKICYDEIDSIYSKELDRLYVDTQFKSEDKITAMNLVHEVKQAFVEVFQSNTWLDDQTRTLAIEKLSAIRANIGSLNEWKPTHRATRADAFYSRQENSITLTAALLKAPFVDVERPSAFNFGSMGSIIGHEFAHAFDNDGSQYDLNGSLRNWWTRASRNAFHNRTQCLVDQYNQVFDPIAQINLNGSLSLGENIADSVGVNSAFRAFKRHEAKHGSSQLLPGLPLHSEQLFYLSYAQNHCNVARKQWLPYRIKSDPHPPGSHRVNEVLANRPEFAQTFSCAAGSRMNPVQKCDIF